LYKKYFEKEILYDKLMVLVAFFFNYKKLATREGPNGTCSFLLQLGRGLSLKTIGKKIDNFFTPIRKY
jgi:hypothetical protein